MQTVTDEQLLDGRSFDVGNAHVIDIRYSTVKNRIRTIVNVGDCASSEFFLVRQQRHL